MGTVTSHVSITNTPASPDLSNDRKTLVGRIVNDVGLSSSNTATTPYGSFAGVVDDSSGGVTGPAFVTLVKPRKGDVVTLWCKVNTTAGTTVLQPDYATPSNNFVASVLSTTVGTSGTVTGAILLAPTNGLFDMTAIAVETNATTGATAGLVLCKFL
jgi:hypothetical protein